MTPLAALVAAALEKCGCKVEDRDAFGDAIYVETDDGVHFVVEVTSLD